MKRWPIFARPWKACWNRRYREQTLGRVEVRQTFNIAGVGTIAGCYVAEGKIHARQFGAVVEGSCGGLRRQVGSLKRFKDDVREVAAGYECGLSLEGFQDIKQGDVIEAYENIPVMRRITPAPGARSTPLAEDKR